MMKTGVDFSALPQTRLCDPAGYVKPSTGDKGYKTDSTSRCIGERPLPGIVNVKAFEGLQNGRTNLLWSLELRVSHCREIERTGNISQRCDGCD